MNYVWIIEARTIGGDWTIADNCGYDEAGDAEDYIALAKAFHPDWEFRISKYQRVEES